MIQLGTDPNCTFFCLMRGYKGDKGYFCKKD